MCLNKKNGSGETCKCEKKKIPDQSTLTKETRFIFWFIFLTVGINEFKTCQPFEAEAQPDILLSMVLKTYFLNDRKKNMLKYK